VLPPDELQRRVESALDEADAHGTEDRTATLAALEQRVAQLQHPPLPRGPGVKGWSMFQARRVARKLIWWQVEPRMAVQRGIDTDLVAALHTLAQRLDQANLRIDALQYTNERLVKRVAELERARDGVRTPPSQP
jgi:hypothetical protein